MKRVVRTAAVCAVFNCIPVIAFATPAPVFQWTGFYGGVHAGPGMFDMAEYLAPVSPTRDEGLGGGGPIGGLFAGYNSALTGNWIGGIEAEANWSSLEAGYYNDSYGGPKAVAESSIAARLRLGFLSAPNTLVYGSVGVAQGNFDFSRGYYNDNGYDNLHQRLSGVQFAAGIETFVWRDVSVRVENVLTHYDRGVVRKFSTWELQPDVLTSRIGIAYHPGWLGQPQTAPAETPTVRSWSGLYVGGQAGAAMFHTIDDYVSNGYMPTSSYSSSSAEAGLYAGFNMQVGNIVAGIEADGAATNQRAIDGTNSLYGTQKWSGAVRGRVGRAFGNTFVYGSLGWTVSQFDYSEVYPDTTNANGAFTANGLQAGFGAETFVTPNISVRADGLYSDYGRNIVVWKPSLGSDHVLNPRTLEGRLGLSYHLN